MKIDAKARTVELDNGTVLHLRPVSNMLLVRLQNEIEQTKPVIPVVEVQIGGDSTHLEKNPNDPEYLAELREWTANQSQRLMFYAFTAGIVDNVPAEEYSRIIEYFPSATELEIKYYWIIEQLGNGDSAWSDLVDAIMGQTEITQQGVIDSMDSFRGNGKPDPDPTSELEAVTSSDHL